MDEAAITWIVLLGSCVVLTAFGTLIWKRPGTAALCVTGLAGSMVALMTVQKDAFWGMAVIVVLICSFPVTIVTAIVTDNLMDKYSSRTQR